ncbi:HNH endonuclease signature motif containing protein [Knoellia sp. S7-12]|uniref:HNH endonuclease signature motif containing protein n=1 Tax=Knoellia sp. S7-12 TaxID=3126698 RepID=UPI00338E1499
MVKSTGSRCLAPANQCDHIVPNNDHSPRNLQALCVACHKVKTQKESLAARRLKSRRLPPERHPGLL